MLKVRTLTLNDDTIYELDWGHGDKGILNVNIKTDESFIELAVKFSNRELTKHIVLKFGEASTEVYDGYTELQSIQKDADITGTTLIRLFTPARAEIM